MRPRITVIGSSNVDLVMRLPRLPALGQTVGGGTFMQVFGGKGANQAVAAARAGGDVRFVTCVGDDDPGAAMLAQFRQDQIDVAPAWRTKACASGTAMILIDARGDNCIAVAPGANHCITPQDIDARADVIRGSAMLLLQMEIPSDANRRALALAQEHGTPVLFNYAPAQVRDVPVTAAMTGLVVNETEASELTGRLVTDVASATAAAQELRAGGPRFVIVTLGRAGACTVSDEGVFHRPALQVKAVDSTAAGDTFCGALGVALAEGQPLPRAVDFASAAAALCVTRSGAQPSIPAREEIAALLRGSPASP